MTTETSPIDPRVLEDADLLSWYIWAENALAECQQVLHRIQQELERRMLDREATEIAHPSIECRLEKGTPTWDYGKLAALLEMLPPDVISTAWTAPYDEMVHFEEKWNMTKAKTFKRFGANVTKVIDDATIPGRSRLVVKK